MGMAMKPQQLRRRIDALPIPGAEKQAGYDFVRVGEAIAASLLKLARLAGRMHVVRSPHTAAR
jgi:hypothetical protein